MPKPILFVVDDDEEELRLLERDLEHEYGERYGVLGATSGQEALEKLRQLKNNNEPVALLVADYEMPQMNGVEFLDQAVTLFPDAKRVLLTAYTENEAAISAIKTAGIDHFLTKPWQPPEQNLYPALNDLLADWEACPLPHLKSVRIVGYRFSPEAHQTRDFLVRNCVPFEWLDIERDEKARRLLAAAGVDASRLPIVIFPDGARLVRPSNAEIAEKIGLKARPGQTSYDLVIVGGGPAGLAAAVYGASEGLRTVMVEREAPGGQAGQSSRIENYLGFPAGLTGSDLARRATDQARRLGAELLTVQDAVALEVEGAGRGVRLSGGSTLSANCVLVASGVSYSQLDTPGFADYRGRGIYYGAARTEARACSEQHVVIIGGANSAGQAAVYFAKFAARVSMLVRPDTLEKSMSHYLIDQLAQLPNVQV